MDEAEGKVGKGIAPAPIPDSGAAIGPHREVVLHFSLCLEGGCEVESSFGAEPLRFTVGDGTLEPALEQRLFGLRAGERREFSFAPGEIYGLPDPARVHRLPRSDLPPHFALTPGLLVGFETPSGQELPGRVLEVGDEAVTVDFNHPLAGHALTLIVEILAVEIWAVSSAG